MQLDNEGLDGLRRRPEGAKNPSFLRRMGRGFMGLILCPTRGFPKDEVSGGGRLIRTLVGDARLGEAPDLRLRFGTDGRLDLNATAFYYAMTVWQLEALLRNRQHQSATGAYATFGLGCALFSAWLFFALTRSWASWEILPVLEFAPIWVYSLATAFRLALRNYQIRMRRRVGVSEYLGAHGGFWPVL